MRWITMEEAPLSDDVHMVACRYKDFWGECRFTEGEWCDGWHIWRPDEPQWTSYKELDKV